MLYYFWKKRGIFPSDVMARSAGERLVLRAFFEAEVEEQQRALARYSKDAIRCHIDTVYGEVSVDV